MIYHGTPIQVHNLLPPVSISSIYLQAPAAAEDATATPNPSGFLSYVELLQKPAIGEDKIEIPRIDIAGYYGKCAAETDTGMPPIPKNGVGSAGPKGPWHIAYTDRPRQ